MPDVAAAALSMSDEPNQITNAFRLAMRRTGQTVTVIACRDNDTGARYGLTASSVTSLSMNPPSLLACINNDASVQPYLQPGQAISVNILSQDQAAISTAFAMEPDQSERFNHGHWDDAPPSQPDHGQPIPYLADCLSCVLAEIVNVIPHSSHTVVIAEVQSAITDPLGKPLIYHDGDYAKLAEQDPD
ncbi:MAG: flavin reductase family protein [Pseudomonadota bacterium]